MDFRKELLIEFKRCTMLAFAMLGLSASFFGCAAPTPPEPAVEKDSPPCTH